MKKLSDLATKRITTDSFNRPLDASILPSQLSDVPPELLAYYKSIGKEEEFVKFRLQGAIEDDMFVVQTANYWLHEAHQRPNPVQLWDSLWYEGELCCLFADTNVGKSIYAVQIGNEIAKTHPVLYFDFEMSDKQFQLRFTSDDNQRIKSFNNGFLRVEFNKESMSDFGLRRIINSIENNVIKWDCKVVIIDNISWICNRAESGDAAGELMQMLIGLKRKLGLSILVLAHTPKRNTSAPITQNSLAGSKRIANFMDSMFAIGVARGNGTNKRYIKQLKVRNCEMHYGEDNVITADIVKDDVDLRFEHTGYARECDLLDCPDEPDVEREEKYTEIRRRLDEGQTMRSIAKEMRVSLRDINKAKKPA